MKRFNYLTIYSYIENQKWVINYSGIELNKSEYQEAIFEHLGNEGWQLITVSSDIATEVGNSASFEGNGSGSGDDVYTSAETFYFQREVIENNERQYSKPFETKLQYLKQILDDQVVYEKKEKELRSKFKSLIYDALIKRNYKQEEGINGIVTSSWYKDLVKEKMTKQIFSENITSQQVKQSRVDVKLGEKVFIWVYEKEKDDSEWKQVYLPLENLNLTENNVKKLNDFLALMDSDKVFL